jgi:hypothetical protein
MQHNFVKDIAVPCGSEAVSMILHRKINVGVHMIFCFGNEAQR